MRKKFKVIKCPKCYAWQVISASKTFRCRFCGYSTEVRKLNIFFESDNAVECSYVVKALKEKK